MSVKESLAQQAERLDVLVTSLVADSRNHDAASTVQRVIRQAEDALSQLQLVESGLTELKSQGVERPSVTTSLRDEAATARAALRRAASAITGSKTQEMASRVSGASVGMAIETADKVARSLTTQSRRAAEAKRQAMLPVDLLAPIPPVAGVNQSVMLSLRRMQSRLQQPIPEGSSATDAATRLAEDVALVAEWAEKRPLVHAAAEHQHPDVRAFIAAASGADGATRSMLTDAVAAWLEIDGNSDGVRIFLT